MAGKRKRTETHKMAYKRARTSGGVTRAYPGSRVPLRSGGYRPNKAEWKVNDIAVGTIQVNTTGTVTLLANPALGSDMNNRIGRKIRLKSAYIRGFLSSEASNGVNADIAVSSQQCRMIIFADLQPNGAAPAVTDLLNSASPASHLNLNNRDRFKVYCDKTYVLDPYIFNDNATVSQASTVNQIRNVKKYKKINLESVYNGTNGGTIADINSGALFMLWIGSNAAGTNTDATAILSTRVRYVDV